MFCTLGNIGSYGAVRRLRRRAHAPSHRTGHRCLERTTGRCGRGRRAVGEVNVETLVELSDGTPLRWESEAHSPYLPGRRRGLPSERRDVDPCLERTVSARDPGDGLLRSPRGISCGSISGCSADSRIRDRSRVLVERCPAGEPVLPFLISDGLMSTTRFVVLISQR